MSYYEHVGRCQAIDATGAPCALVVCHGGPHMANRKGDWTTTEPAALLPEVLTVNNPTPRLDAPFSLRGEASTASRETQPDLFRGKP